MKAAASARESQKDQLASQPHQLLCDGFPSQEVQMVIQKREQATIHRGEP
jgi:hypothetical protein